MVRKYTVNPKPSNQYTGYRESVLVGDFDIGARF